MTSSCRSCAGCERELSTVRLDLISALGQAQEHQERAERYREALEQIIKARFYGHRGTIARAALNPEPADVVKPAMTRWEKKQIDAMERGERKDEDA